MSIPMCNDDLVQVHLHTWFSRRDSIASPKAVVTRVKELGQSAVAVTDHGCTSGLLETYKECQKQGIKMIFGVEHYLVPDVTVKGKGYSHICMWAMNNTGYKNLLKLTTLANQNFYRKPLLDIDIIRQHSEGIAISSACLGGWLRKKVETTKTVLVDNEFGVTEDIIETTYEPNIELLEKFIAIFPDSLYLELHTYSADEQKEWNKVVLGLADKYSLPVLAACDSHYINKEDSYTHKMFITQGNDREDGYYQRSDFYIHSSDNVRESLSYLPTEVVEQSIANTQVLTDRCNVTIAFGEKHYPTVDIDDKKEAVLQIMRDNFLGKVPDKTERPKHVQRIHEEMPILEKADYFPYFLIMHDIVTYCRKHDIPLGFSRGSAGGCDVAYLMDIHSTNAIKFDLMFARFLHEERITPCDIDLDCSQERRGEVIQYIKDKYGHDRVFQARTYSYMGEAGALQMAGRALKMPPSIIDSISKSFVSFDEVQGYPELVSLAKGFVGILQSFSVHASGIIVFPDDPSNYTAIEKSGDNFITGYEFHTLEELGNLKLDILGVKMCDVIHNTVKLIPKHIDVNNIPLDDKVTFDMLCEGKSSGVFQIESSGFTGLVKRVQPRHFEDLAPLMAAYRPAIISAGLLDTYIKRVTGEEETEYLHPDLEPLLKGTAGMMLYQENLIEVAKTICGYTAGQADMLRRACGRKIPEDMAKLRPDFISRAVAHGYTEEFSTQLFDLCEFFAGYGFGKGHSYGYGWMSYVTAYLKANYPKEYMVSLINSEKKQEDIIPYINECKNLGIPVLPPDARCNNMPWVIEGDNLRIGIGHIKGLGKNTSLDSVDSLSSIIRSNPKNVVIGLIKAGALDYLGERSEMLGSVESLQDTMKRIDGCEAKVEENKKALALATDAKDIKKYKRQMEQWQAKLSEAKAKEVQGVTGEFDIVASECEVLGFSFHEIPLVKPGSITKIFKKNDKNGNEMAWLSLLSNYGSYRATVFSKGWSLIKDIVSVGQSVKFVVDKDILQEISVNGTVYQTNQKKQWKPK